MRWPKVKIVPRDGSEPIGKQDFLGVAGLLLDAGGGSPRRTGIRRRDLVQGCAAVVGSIIRRISVILFAGKRLRRACS
jgi:hypothetical protein